MKTNLFKFQDLYLKREDENITGSAKDRALEKQVDYLVKNNIKNAVLSSTGNAAISALYFCQKENISLTLFLSPKIDIDKLKMIKKYQPKIIFSLKPISDALKFSKNNNHYFLRQSTDPIALDAYKAIGDEIIEQLPQVTSVFIPIGSGTTLLGIAKSFPKNITIFGAQSLGNPTVAKVFNHSIEIENSSVTDALSVKVLPLKSDIIFQIKEHNGTVFAIKNSEIQKEHQELINNNIKVSPETALCLAAYKQAKELNLNIGKYPVIICTGAYRHE